MRTGILGGTFNPPHLGHLHAAELAHRALNLDRVLFIPTNIPPHKVLPENTASAEDRCEMVRRLTAEKPWAMLDTIEIDRGGASYTVDTLRALHARGETDLHLIVGTDMLLAFDKIWRAPDEIARLASLAVCARENEDWDALREKAAQLRETYSLLGLFKKDAAAYVKWYESKNAAEIPAAVRAIAEERLAARAAKDWAKSDALRAKLAELGYAVKDSKEGYTLTKN